MPTKKRINPRLKSAHLPAEVKRLQSENKALRAQIETLNKKVAILEERIEELSQNRISKRGVVFGGRL